MKRLLIGLLGCGLLAITVAAQEAQPGVDEVEVRRLVRQLENRQRAARDEAEAQLRALGAPVLPMLPKIDARTPGELKQRLLRIREQLEQQRTQASVDASRLTLQGKMTLSAAFAAIKEQSGNEIVDYRSRFNQQSTDTELQLDLQDVPFWEGVDRVLDEAGLTIYSFAGEAKKLAVNAQAEGAIPRVGSAAYSGLFRIEATNLFAERDLRNSSASTLRLNLELIWEPRVVPILIQQDLEEITIEADNGEELGLTTTGMIQLPVQPGVSVIDLRLPVELPSREVKAIKSLQGEFTALVPGGIVEFEFPKLAGARNIRQKRGGITVTLERVRKNGGVQELSVRVRLGQTAGSLESHLDWVANNEAILLDPQGQPADEPNYEKYLEREDEVGFRYLFPVGDDLSGYKFVYKTPAGIAEIPVAYELQDISLP